ncbi:hypothetical protein [Campylobacter troglodytis]|nr:hypothetical protein [Campylobacter troglodytis]
MRRKNRLKPCFIILKRVVIWEVQMRARHLPSVMIRGLIDETSIGKS